ncbi:EI24 domain-containing protein [Roseivivax isoporae]|uniref:Membrane protein n=1 Tax=Roseivivax isoporae LMG 25204 TaxID=1449351 RepID=X7F6J4_9RHOB|nr:EI24 domain-containing protein [Roseivivax isoporae]ETX27689.1 membrane protein [Roseivivax isoporae LMG 25204]
MILRAVLRAIGQLGDDPRFRRVLWTGLALTVALLAAFYVAFVWLVTWLVPDTFSLPWAGEITWLDDVAGAGSILLMLVLSVFLMVPVASAITSMFLDNVAQAVEDRHYPALPEAERIPFLDAVRDTAGFMGVLVAANLGAFLLYLLLPPFAPFIFWAMNGFLLGREYYTLAAMRRVGRAGAMARRRRHAATIWIAGVLMAVPLSVPILNLLVPILGAATFTHLFHALEARSARV